MQFGIYLQSVEIAQVGILTQVYYCEIKFERFRENR